MYQEDFDGASPQNGMFEKFSKISNHSNSKPEIYFVTISTAFKNVWGTLNIPLKTFGQGVLEGGRIRRRKRSITSNDIFSQIDLIYLELRGGLYCVFPLFYSMGNDVSLCAKLVKYDEKILREVPPKSAQNENFKSP